MNRVGLGDRVATRRNHPGLGVANRQTWTVTGIGEDGSLNARWNGPGHHRDHQLPAEYVSRHVELAYATTAYGAPGDTVPCAHVVIGEHTSAAAAYVGMTRGRENNTAHLVADNLDDARRQWVEVFSAGRADLGPTRARQRAIEDTERYGPDAPRRRARGSAASARPQGPEPAYHPPVAAPDRGIVL